MIRSCIRQAVRAFAGTAFFSCALAANAGGITLSDSNCDSFSLSGPAGNQVLTCVVSNAPANCSIQGPSTGTNNVAITLTAVCASGSPTTYAWTGGNCANVTTQSCQAIGNNQTVIYGVTPSNGIGPGNTPTKSVLWSAALPVKPSQCSITADTNPLPAGGGSVNLTAQCGGGDGVDSWTWSGPVTTTSGNTATAAISVSSTFGVTATNGGGNGSASLTVNVSGSGGGGGSTQCSGFLNTNVVTMTWPNWTSNTRIPMGVTDAAILKFTTGPASAQTASFTLYSGSGQISNHDIFVSATPCDFDPSHNLLPYLRFKVGTPGSQSIPELQANSTYYINIRNSSGAVCLSGAFPCDLFVNSQKP